MPGISSASSARGVSKGFIPSKVIASPAAAIADGATGNAPPGCSEEWETRPTCQSWSAMRPPSRWTVSVTIRQPATCSGEWMPGVSG